ncbi:hypothetical protein A0H81_00402 [Grifola frondosa]|uniref:Uncharacterized protein n=1 Tax=Grifola frondosa TaxID=5627 RepID=A0A1C7MQ21_GRIFR|nr:hypothetical protein A0H81_00402 [Grifola frondosa]
MGRKARYLTSQARVEATRETKNKYNHSPHRGRVARRKQNQRAYAHCCNKLVLEPLPNLLPSNLIHLAKRPLEANALFWMAAHDTTALDESDLSTWNEEPPYSTITPADEADDQEFGQNCSGHGRKAVEGASTEWRG